MSGGTQPKYREIAAELRTSIRSGQYRGGDQLPGENHLMERYQVARMTARNALAVLLNEGIAVARKGAGVYVRDFRPIVRDGIARLAGDGWGSGVSIWSNDVADDRDLSVEGVEVYETDAPAHIAVALGRGDQVRVWWAPRCWTGSAGTRPGG